MSSQETPNFALHTAGLTWQDPDLIKNMLLLFDGIAFVAPPKYHGDLLMEEFWRRGLVRPAQPIEEYRHIDPYLEEVPLPWLLHALVMSLWTSVVKAYSTRVGMLLSPCTDDAYDHDFASRVLEPIATTFQESYILRPLKFDRSKPVLIRLFVGDIHRFGIDVSAAPIDEILSFRRAHHVLLDAYLADLRNTALTILSIDDPNEQKQMLAARSGSLADQASDIRSRARQEFLIQSGELGVAVSAVAAVTSHWNPIAALLAGVTTAAAAAKFFLPEQASQYRYLLVAQERFRYRPWN